MRHGADDDATMFTSTHLYDKRREPCFMGLPGARFGHVSSNVADSVHTAVVLSALHRCSVNCGDLDNFVLEVARVVKDLSDSKYKTRRVWCTVKRFVMSKAAWRYGETNHMYVLVLIYHELSRLMGLPPPFGCRPPRQHFYRYFRQLRHWYRCRLPC